MILAAYHGIRSGIPGVFNRAVRVVGRGPYSHVELVFAERDAVERGELLVLNPTMVEYLTYWRPDDVYVRWDGEWVYRNDPTRIAF